MPKLSDDRMARLLNTPQGKVRFQGAFRLACAKTADALTEGTLAWYMARRLAGLPLFPRGHRPGHSQR
jgi:hypothetical protein